MAHFFLEKPPLENEIVLRGQERHHLMDVYRATPGMRVTLFDRMGIEYDAEIISCHEKEMHLRILEKRHPSPPEDLQIFLAQGIIQSQNWDLLLQKAMELDLYGLFPMITQHLGRGKQSAGKPERWEKIMIAAAKQCHRSHFIQIFPMMSFAEVLEKTTSFSLRLLAHPYNAEPLKTVLDSQSSTPRQILVMVGPEGGFSEGELAQAKEQGIAFCSLGKYTLKAETAALALISNLHFYFSDRH